MARSGRFGRLPRSAPDLTGTIVALLREYAAMRERNVVDAWNHGGTFEGKKVTDDMLLDFYREKLANLDPSDPLYEETKNTLTQYDFAIANSKMEVRYAQHKVSDGAMAAFYKRWAKKLPRDSEAYRNLQRLAAQYRDRAVAGSGRRSAAAANRVYGNKWSAIYRSKELVYDTIGQAIENLAQRYGILNSEKETLGDLQASELDSSRLISLFNELATSPAYADWRKAATEFLRKNGDPKFNGDFSYNNWVSLGSDKQAGILQRIKLAKNNGRKADANSANKELANFWKTHTKVGSVDAVAAYEAARQQWESIITDPTATLAEKWAANEAYKSTLGDILKTVIAETPPSLTFEGDNTLIARLGNELTALTGEDPHGPTLQFQTDPDKASKAAEGESDDAASTAASVRDLGTALSHLYERDPNGNPLYYMAMVDADGNPTEQGTWAAVPASAFSGQDKAVVQVDDPATVKDQNGVPVPTAPIVTAVIGVPVYGEQYPVDATGKRVGQNFKVNPGENNYLGARFQMPDGSYIFKWTDDAGKVRYSYSSPFQNADGSDATLTPSKSGLTVTTAVTWDATMEGQQKPRYEKTANLKPSYVTSDTADDMPNTIFHSSYAAWLKTPGTHDRAAIRADSTADVAAILKAESDDLDQLRLAANEIDEMRAAALGTSPDDEWRLIRANSRGGANTLATEAYRNLLGLGDTHQAPGYEYAMTREEIRAAEMLRTPLEDIYGDMSKNPWAFELKSKNSGVTPPKGPTRTLDTKYDMRPINTAGLAGGVFRNISEGINRFADDYSKPRSTATPKVPKVTPTVFPTTGPAMTPLGPPAPTAPPPPKPPKPPAPIYEPPPPPPPVFTEPPKPPSPVGSPVIL